MSGPEVITFGCRLNSFESEVMRGHAERAGLADAVIVNTCAVTAEAERQARQAIRRIRRRRPEARILVTGCAAQIDPARFAAMPGVERVLGNAEKLDPASFGPEKGERVRVNDIMALTETGSHLIEGFDGRARTFVQVQNGCDHRCTFCIIPYGRGPSRSVPSERVITQVQRLMAAGFREVVLTGVDLTAYGADLPEQPTLGALVRELLDAVPALERLRLSSLDIAEVDAELKRAIADDARLMPHLHLSLQSGDDLLLKRMRRRHSRAQAIEFCAELRELRPGIAFGADFIAGFPTESEAMACHTVDMVEACGLAFLHVFPFSPRPGTPAARMPQVPAAERKARAARLREAGERALGRFLAGQVGSPARVLVERDGRGRSEHYAPVVLDEPAPDGEIVRVLVTGVRDGALIGSAAALRQ